MRLDIPQSLENREKLRQLTDKPEILCRRAEQNHINPVRNLFFDISEQPLPDPATSICPNRQPMIPRLQLPKKRFPSIWPLLFFQDPRQEFSASQASEREINCFRTSQDIPAAGSLFYPDQLPAAVQCRIELLSPGHGQVARHGAALLARTKKCAKAPVLYSCI